MSKKAKTEVDEKSAVIITDAVLAENQAKLDSYEKSIKAVQERRRKVCDCGAYADRQADSKRYDL